MPATQWPIARTGNYYSTHKHVRRVRGPASEHACRCGSAAEQWAYDHADPDEAQGAHPYSLKPEHYRPLCSPCHVKEDGARARRARTLSGEPPRRCLRCSAGCQFDYCTKHHVTVKPPPAPTLNELGIARSAGRPRLALPEPSALSGEVKHCRSCDTTKPIESFYLRKDKPGVRRSRCRECDRAYSSKRYAVVGSPSWNAGGRRTDRLRAADRERNRSHRAAAVAIYGGCCEWCGSSDQLEFDHVDGDGSQHREVECMRRMILRIARTGARLTTHRLRLLCADCHRGPGWRERRAAPGHLALTV